MRAEHRPISPPSAKGSRGKDLPAYLSNGLIGLRVREDPLRAGLCIVSGFVGEHHEKRIEAAVAAPFPLGLDIALGGLWASDQSASVEPIDQAYDFETAEVTTRARLIIGADHAEVEVVAFCCRSHPTLVAERITVRVDAACDLTIRPRIDVAGVRGSMVERRLDTPGEDPPVCDGSLLWASEGDLGRVGLALATVARFEAERTQEPWDELGPLSTTYRTRGRNNRAYVVDRLVSLVPDVQHAEPHRQAVRLVAHGAEIGFDELRKRNRAVWADLWKGRIRLVGAEERWQALADAALFYLNTSTHGASPASTSIYGLATWRDYHYYFGHVMWDVDAFATPVLSLLQPPAAEAMLDFRHRSMAAARANAQMHGRRGLQYPWEAGMRHGQEAAPGGAGASARELHVNMHVARAFALHADAGGDPRFLEERAWPVLSGVCDWIVDRVEPTPGGRFRFAELGGPAENPGFIDEDALTTMSARVVLKQAAEAARQLGKAVPPDWLQVAEGLAPPMRADGAIASHAGYRTDEAKGATPSALMGLFPYWADVDAETEQKTFDLYVKQWDDYVGSPMLAALYGAWAAWRGDRALALKLFDEGYARYAYDRFSQILEYRLDRVEGVASGPFFANIGGFLTSLLMGLPAIKVSSAEPADWPQRPVVLPEGWSGVECDQLWIRGRAWTMRARHGADRAELAPAKA